MLRTVFTVNLSEKIVSGKVCIGKFDGTNPCIVAATSTDKVLIHNPYSRSVNSDGKWVVGTSATDINFLSINQTINSLCSGKLKPGQENESLAVGTPTSILVYDVLNNVDVFYRDIPDGSNSVTIGYIGSIDKPLAIAGGNCALQGFDFKGEDSYWTVTGDNITALTLCDIDEDGENELIVGSEDFDIRVFKDDVILYELSETDAIKALCPVGSKCFAYALANGTVGVYHKKERLWRIKSKNQAVCIIAFDVNGDGAKELVTGWTNGKIDARNLDTGEVIFKENLNHGIAGIMAVDYNLDGVEELVVITVTGEVRGYVPNLINERQTLVDENLEQEVIRDLMKKRHNLLMEVRNYEIGYMEPDSHNSPTIAKPSTEDDEFGSIPANTQLKSSIILNTGDKQPHIVLSLETSNETIIRGLVIFAEGIFNGESHVAHPNENEISTVLNVPLRPPKDIPIDLHIKAMIGYKGSYHYHVFELTRHLPRFSMYVLTSRGALSPSDQPSGSVGFILNEKFHKVVQWLNKNFILENELTEMDNEPLVFTSLRDGKLLVLNLGEKSGECTIRTENMELAGVIIQSLCAEFLNLDDLQSTANFPIEVDTLKKLIVKVEEIQSVRQQLGAEIADNSGAVRSLVVRAEDARLLGEFKMMKQHYMDLHVLNRELINEYRIRSQNHKDLVDSLKLINAIIQKAGNLRIGPSKTRLIQACRLAIKQNNFNSLARIICEGEV